jgi:hypothetical protein
MDYLAITIPTVNPQCSMKMTQRDDNFCCPAGHYLMTPESGPAICRRADNKSWCPVWKYNSEVNVCEHPYHSWNNQPYYNVSGFVTRQWPLVAKNVNEFLGEK